MIQHVYERAKEVRGVHDVIVATDDQRIYDAVLSFHGSVTMTSCDHCSGTDRLTEVMTHYPADIYVNIQGDEPLIRPEDIETLVHGMQADPSVAVGTLCHPISAQEALSPNIVKVVMAENGNALYFSRSVIPHNRDGDVDIQYLKHVGVYAYRKDILERYATLSPSVLENTEKLEQLRLLSAGIPIRAFLTEPAHPGIDTPECLERIRMIMSGKEILPPPSFEEQLKDIRLVITDVDGVLTDGTLYINEEGEFMKAFNVKDGLGIHFLQKHNVQVAFLSGRDSAPLRKRMKELGISLAMLGSKDKATACREIMEKAGVSPEQTVFLGDDSIDVPGFMTCGLSVAVADAPQYIQDQVNYVLSKSGGKGAFRELADAILTAQGKEDVFSYLDFHGTALTDCKQ